MAPMRSSLLLFLAPLASCAPSFDEYLRQYGKSYSAAEYVDRKALFERRALEVRALNARPAALWKAGFNEMSDLTPNELKERFGYNKALREDRPGGAPVLQAQAGQLPSAVDWRTHSPPVMTAVKQQGACGSCWAFAASEAIESNIALLTGRLLTLSPQQLNSCTPNPKRCGGTGGCQGATAELAFGYAVTAGLVESGSYPYHSGRSGQTGACNDTAYHVVARISSYAGLPSNDAHALAQTVAMVGPVAVSVDAFDWFLYEGGIFDRCNKTHLSINHAVLLVGYGEENGTKYWIVRNSWGASWGENGYIRLRRWDQEPCALDSTPLEGFGCVGGPSEITVCGECGVLSDSSFPMGGHIDDGRRRLRESDPASAGAAAGAHGTWV